MSKPRLYYFGRSCLLVFVILFLEGVGLHIFSLQDIGIGSAPAFILNYIAVLKYALPVLCPVAIVSAIAIMHQKDWARYSMAVVLAMGAIGIVVFGVVFIFNAMGAPDEALASSRIDFMIYAPLAVLLQVAGISWCAWYLLKNGFEERDAALRE